MYDVLFPAGMIAAPVFFCGLWCLWTGVRGLLPMLLATLGVLVAFAAATWHLGPHATWLWGMAPFFGLLFGLGLPLMRRALVDLPELPRGASLKPRRVELFPFALVWPFFAWAAIVACVVWRGEATLVSWLGPALGIVNLAVMPLLVRATVLEPEPLGGPDPEALERRYGAFRRRRAATTYWLAVTLSLAVTASAAFRVGWAVLGPALGAWGALFGTWADAQRYLLRLQLSGAEPPVRIRV